ncbi:MAG: 4-(cytidine 5'-diphospho)-2-C-methyl-D-erythritol kinase, partial [Bacteroidia bacterium]
MKNEFRPAAKINLGLRILERLPNGYHRLETLMFPLEAPADSLVITAHNEDVCQLQMTGRPIDGNMADNLVVRAWKALKEVYPAVAGV